MMLNMFLYPKENMLSPKRIAKRLRCPAQSEILLARPASSAARLWDPPTRALASVGLGLGSLRRDSQRLKEISKKKKKKILNLLKKILKSCKIPLKCSFLPFEEQTQSRPGTANACSFPWPVHKASPKDGQCQQRHGSCAASSRAHGDGEAQLKEEREER